MSAAEVASSSHGTSVATGSEFPVPGRFRVLLSRVRAGYGYTPKFKSRVPGTLRVIGRVIYAQEKEKNLI